MDSPEIAVNVFKWLTIVTALMVRVSLLPDFRRMHQNHSTGDMSVMPCLLLLTNCYAVMMYALVINNIFPLFVVSILGCITGLVFNIFFYRWSIEKRFVLCAFIGSFAVCMSVTVYCILALNGYTGQSRAAVSTTLGFVTIGTTIGMYVSPLATIARVLRTKTASSMPFTMGVVNVANSVCWGVYAALIDDMFIFGPNVVGFVLGCIQIVLTLLYGTKISNLPERVNDSCNSGGLSETAK
ncbi:hypothetical protein L917_02827 [Plasmopara halstedii]|uniref:Sugar transporter SWEET1 n=1 Tax=Plasmopara halstedii TaxID=4781 RepID=A0A0P1AB47_PLAHL|nr:hypothetical protein L917_02827 [Plasmopara halstedii]CEG38058.1 hypothetical protein L917_02827 [Plasmopara halstedii]|eukprot:XP_024574427.1 hypothetical protein L917_02827 [Plasmopara halstedii]